VSPVTLPRSEDASPPVGVEMNRPAVDPISRARPTETCSAYGEGEGRAASDVNQVSVLTGITFNAR